MLWPTARHKPAKEHTLVDPHPPPLYQNTAISNQGPELVGIQLLPETVSSMQRLLRGKSCLLPTMQCIRTPPHQHVRPHSAQTGRQADLLISICSACAMQGQAANERKAGHACHATPLPAFQDTPVHTILCRINPAPLVFEKRALLRATSRCKHHLPGV